MLVGPRLKNPSTLEERASELSLEVLAVAFKL
jgi:hypothetical protein